jgi:HSP20 family molecular chaperone IbpA
MMTRWMNPFEDPFFRGFFDRELDRMTTTDNQAWRRSIRLPHPVNADAADAKFDKGMLTITFPMKAEPKTKTIELH